MELKNAIYEIVSETIGIPIENVNMDITLADLGADDLDILQIFESIEHMYGKSINTTKLGNIKTVSDIISFVKNI